MEGIVSNAIKCTPNDNPISSAISSSHLLPLGSCMASPHFRPAQNRSAMNNDAMAYTSASVALYQKLSEKRKARLAVKALPKTAFALLEVISPFVLTIFVNKMVTDQNINSMVNADESTDTMLIIKPVCCGEVANMANIDPIIWNSGAPGGWPICNFAEVDWYSQQSQKLREGSAVMV